MNEKFKSGDKAKMIDGLKSGVVYTTTISKDGVSRACLKYELNSKPIFEWMDEDCLEKLNV